MDESEQIETYKEILRNKNAEVKYLNDTIQQLSETISSLHGEPAPLVDKIFDVVLDGKFAADIVNSISKTGKATIKLYGNQIVEIL